MLIINVTLQTSLPSDEPGITPSPTSADGALTPAPSAASTSTSIPTASNHPTSDGGEGADKPTQAPTAASTDDVADGDGDAGGSTHAPTAASDDNSGGHGGDDATAAPTVGSSAGGDSGNDGGGSTHPPAPAPSSSAPDGEADHATAAPTPSGTSPSLPGDGDDLHPSASSTPTPGPSAGSSSEQEEGHSTEAPTGSAGLSPPADASTEVRRSFLDAKRMYRTTSNYSTFCVLTSGSFSRARAGHCPQQTHQPPDGVSIALGGRPSFFRQRRTDTITVRLGPCNIAQPNAICAGACGRDRFHTPTYSCWLDRDELGGAASPGRGRVPAANPLAVDGGHSGPGGCYGGTDGGSVVLVRAVAAH